MNQKQKLLQLSTITELALSASETAMAKVTQEEAKLRQQLTALSASARNTAEPGSPASQAGADVRWQRWADSRREEINVELARVLAKKSAARKKLKTAFGKNQAMKSLVAKQA